MGQGLLIFLLFTPFTSEREWNTSIPFDRVQERAKLLVNDGRVSNSIDSLDHRCMWVMFHCTIAIATDFPWAKLVNLIPRIKYFSVTLVFLSEYSIMCSIGQGIAQYLTNKIRSLGCNFLAFKRWKRHKIQKNYQLQSKYKA